MEPIQHIPGHIKPWGGIWTSTWNPTWNSSAWVDLTDNLYRLRRHVSANRLRQYDRVSSQRPCDTDTFRWWLLTPQDNARVLEIDTLEDIEHCLAEHGRMVDLRPDLQLMLHKKRGRFVDYPHVAASYDAIHVTAHAAKLGSQSLMWDCESTLWFSWQFADIQLFRIK
jgi:hypothetical protein